ncbi:MAG: MFS transporter [Anaerolineae bacterium]
MKRTFHSLQIRDYRWFWIGMVASFNAMQMQVVARGWLVYEMTDSAFALGGVTAALGIAILIVSPIGGVVADRVEKRNLLILTQGSIMLITLILAVLISTEKVQYWHLIASAIATGVIYSFNMPGRQAFIPELVGEEDLMNAVALNSAGMNLTRILGPALAGILMGLIDVAGVYYVVAACYIVVIATLLTIPPSGSTATRVRTPMLTDLWEGVTYIRHNPTVTMLLAAALATVLFGMQYQTFMPIFARDILQVGASGLGWLMALSGVGALLGSLAVASLTDYEHKGWLLLGAGLLFGIALILFSLSRSFYASLVILMAVGAGGIGYMAINSTLIISSVPHEVRGRVMSVYLMTFGLNPLGALPAGAIANMWGAPLAIGLGGAILLVFFVRMGLTQSRLREL